ncbi:MAG TPA: DNA repair protein RadA [Candidatus Binatia bacterium]|nr:DNA repair protein RadA [Candidatus Binatia bacterium]
MAKASVRYVCSNCGAISSSWTGRCSQCGEWNTLQEEVVTSPNGRKFKSTTPLLIESIDKVALSDQPRFSSGLSELDNILGGGFVPGSVILLAGQPGIGKSTLLLQIAAAVAAKKLLYVSGEESAHQVALRAERLNLKASGLQLATAIQTDDVAAAIATKDYQLVFVDSIQTMTSSGILSAAGTISQITASTQLIMAAAKSTNTTVIIVGHVTKEGMIAGPKVLEHVVDVVLQLEGEALAGFKLLRSTKNRFGSTDEAAIFEMVESGLKPVLNPSAALLEERQITDGSVVLATLEGTRPLLVEVQALVNKSSYGYPKRAASGLDLSRLNLLVAMLERRTKLKLSDQDIYVNIVGGIRLQDPASDLAVCMAIGSAAKAMQLKANAVVFGEVGLSGEVRRVSFTDRRISEAKKLGFDTIIGPLLPGNKKVAKYYGVADVRTALNQFLV